MKGNELEELLEIKEDSSYVDNIEELFSDELLDIKEKLAQISILNAGLKLSMEDTNKSFLNKLEGIENSLGSVIRETNLMYEGASEAYLNLAKKISEKDEKKDTQIAGLKDELIFKIKEFSQRKTTLDDVEGLKNILNEIRNQPVSQPLTLDIYDGTTLLKGAVTKINAPGSTYSNGIVNLVSGGSSLTLKTNNVNNGSQAILNLKQGTNVTLVDDGVGGVTINSGAGSTALSVVSKTADYTATIADDVINCDTSGGPINITVPAANLLTKILRIKITSTSTNTVTLLPTGGGFIDGQGSYNIANPLHKPAVSVISDGTNYQIH